MAPFLLAFHWCAKMVLLDELGAVCIFRVSKSFQVLEFYGFYGLLY